MPLTTAIAATVHRASTAPTKAMSPAIRRISSSAPAKAAKEPDSFRLLEKLGGRTARQMVRKAEEAATEVERRAAEEAARQEQLRLEAVAREAEAQRQRELDEQVEYERKLERDARYAARKERKKKRKSASERYG